MKWSTYLALRASDGNKLPGSWGFLGISSNPNKFMSWVWLHILKDPSVSFSYIIKGEKALGKSFHDMVFPNKWHHLCLSINGASNYVEGVLVKINFYKLSQIST